MLIWLRSDWQRPEATYPAGSLLATDYEQFLAGTADLRVVFAPDARTSLGHFAWTRRNLLVLGQFRDTAAAPAR